MLTPPFRHRATVERDVESGVDAWNAPLPRVPEVLEAAQPCDYWVDQETLVEGPNIAATVEMPRMLIPRDATVTVGDEVPEVRNERGEVISSGRLRVTGDVRQEPSHRELRLELAASPKAPEGS